MASRKLELKLLVDRAGQKVLFAEAGKDVVDFLFSVLALPLADVVRLLNESMVGCLGKLYQSVESLEDSYIQGNQSKSHVLTPRVVSRACSGDAALTWKKDSVVPPTYYRCADKSGCRSSYCTGGCVRNGCGYFCDHAGVTCPVCSATMSTQMKYVVPPGDGKAAGSSGGAGGETGFVKGVVTYMVMDDLSVAPMSTISSIALLNKFGVKDLGSLEETTVELGMDEAVAMLKASLTSTTVLTDVFLPKNMKTRSSFCYSVSV